MKLLICLFLVLWNFVSATSAWDTEELEIFDLVEDINENFYTLLGVQQDATLSEIKRAFRNLSLVLHPDKNDAPDAEVKFRNLVFIYEVLKDSSKREKYNNVLKNGLPNWKSAMYYYRKVHKMGLLEMSIILFVILTVGQYIIAWAAYAEKKYTAETLIGSRLKRMQKKNKTTVDMDTILNEIPSPSIWNTLPFQIPRAIWNIPKAIKGTIKQYADYRREQEEIIEQEKEKIRRQQELEEEYLREKEAKKEGLRKRKEKFAAQEKTDEELEGFARLQRMKKLESIQAASAKNIQTGGLWTDEDLVELIRLVKKYPGGTAARWEVIAEMMNRSVTEITFMAAKMKENGYRVPGQTDSVAETIIQDTQKKLKSMQQQANVTITLAETNEPEQQQSTETNWSQEQQQQLEKAIVEYPKTAGPERWSLIAKSIPGKTKEECYARYNYLVELVKVQKARRKQNQPAVVQQSTEQKKTIESIEKKSKSIKKHQKTMSGEDDSNKIDGMIEQYDDDDEQLLLEKPKNNNKTSHSGGGGGGGGGGVGIVGGKPRNKRKERKQNMEFSNDEDEDSD